jgi:hypothetical protein
MENKLNLHIFQKKPPITTKGTKWKEAWNNKRYMIGLVSSLFFQILTLMLLADFLKYIEQRNGITLNDPILNILKPADFTWITFGLIYTCVFAAIISFGNNPDEIVLAFQAYSGLILIRISAMYLTPLDPPAGMIPLEDPLVEFFGTGLLLTKDLFFSGHTALLFLLFLIETQKYLKILFLASAVIVGICLLFQHVHYSIDVFAAPFFSYAVFRLVLKLRQIIKNTANW